MVYYNFLYFSLFLTIILSVLYGEIWEYIDNSTTQSHILALETF